MKTVTIAMIAMMIAGAQTAAAMTCAEFIRAFHASEAADLLPELDVRQIPDMPEGMMEVTNLRNIETGLSCRGDEFDGFGATLYEGAEPDRLRFAALMSALLEAVAPDEKDRMKLAADLQAEAIDEAAKQEIRNGIYSGTAESRLGDFNVLFGAMKGMVQIDISSR